MLLVCSNDVHLNPDPFCPSPTTSRRTVTNDLIVLYSNSRSLKSFVPVDNPPRKVCKISLLQELFSRIIMKSSVFARHDMAEQYDS